MAFLFEDDNQYAYASQLDILFLTLFSLKYEAKNSTPRKINKDLRLLESTTFYIGKG